jgi:tRNA dimethylallyltransferase
MVQTQSVMPTIIAVVGPTGVGKSKLAVALATMFSGEIISADAFQFYRSLDVGTAKIKPSEQAGIPHHLLDFLDPTETFSVHDYQTLARSAIDQIHARGNNAIVVGGSGLYLNAVFFDYQFAGQKRSETDPDFALLSNEELHDILKHKNPAVAESIHPNNRRRVLRALEIADQIGAPQSEKQKKAHYEGPVLVGLTMDRTRLTELLEQRIDFMIASGLEQEARFIYEHAQASQSAMAIGYKEFFPYFRHESPLPEVIAQIKQNTRRYAKRQLTWFRNQMDCTWFTVDPDDFDKTILQVSQWIQKK